MKRLVPSAGFTSKPTPTNNSNETRSRRERKPRDKFEPNFEATYKRKHSTLSALDLKYNDFNLDSDHIKLDPLNEEYETIMMVQDNNNHHEMDRQLEIDRQIEMEAEKNLHNNRQLEIDELLTHKKEQEQMEDDFLYQNNALTEDIISSFENFDIEEDEPTSYYCHHEILSSDDDIDENTDTDDGANEKVDLTDVNQIIALLVKQRKTIARLRARIDRLIDKVEKTHEELHNHLKRKRQDDNESSTQE